MYMYVYVYHIDVRIHKLKNPPNLCTHYMRVFPVSHIISHTISHTKYTSNIYVYQIIYHSDVVEDIWVPVDEALTGYCLRYTYELERRQRFTHIIWPDHCLVGMQGALSGDKSGDKSGDVCTGNHANDHVEGDLNAYMALHMADDAEFTSRGHKVWCRY
jgi:hypothetical protein